MALVGYARVSAKDQDAAIQIKQLTDAGCVKVFYEKKTGVERKRRVELTACLQYVRDGDTLMVTRLDRLARSVPDFFRILDELKEKGVEFKVLLQPEIDTTTINGRLVMAILAAIAEFETAVRKERQREGIDAAKERGVYKRKVNGRTPQAFSFASRLLNEGLSYEQVEERTGISTDTLRRRMPGYNRRATRRSRIPLQPEAHMTSIPTTPSATEVVPETKPQADPKHKTRGWAKIFLG